MAVLLKYPLHCLRRSLTGVSYDPLFHIHLLVTCKLYRYSVSSLTEHKYPVHWRLLTSQKKHPWSCTWIFTWAWNKRGKRLKTLLMNLRLVQGWVIYSGLGIIHVLLVWFSRTLIMSMSCVTCNLSKTLLACILLLSQCCSWTVLLSNCYWQQPHKILCHFWGKSLIYTIPLLIFEITKFTSLHGHLGTEGSGCCRKVAVIGSDV